MPNIDTGDTTFVLMSTAFVLLMTPGLAFFYGGLVRRKSALNTMMMSFVAMGVVGVAWALLGYSLAFSHSPGGLDAYIGGLKYVFLNDVGAAPNEEYAATIPHTAFMLFQCMFAVITPALVSGAVVERMKFSAYVVFCLAWSLLVYAPVAHWVWSPQGWLHALGALDFAGGTVVHINAGVAALVATKLVGPRKGFPKTVMPPHNVPFALLGTGLLWFGWLGFNGGSALGANGLAASAFVATFFAAAAAAVAWALLDLFGHGKMTGVGLATGAVAGLVAITPAAGFVGPMSAIVMGCLASLVSFYAIKMKAKVGLDDALDVFGVHGVSGILGAVLTGAFASTAINSAGADGSLKLVGTQALATVVTIVFSGVLSFVILKVIGATMGLRIDEAAEYDGADISEHGERAYAGEIDVSPAALESHGGSAAVPALAQKTAQA
jgi:Amt family ammonium transporter